MDEMFPELVLALHDVVTSPVRGRPACGHGRPCLLFPLPPLLLTDSSRLAPTNEGERLPQPQRRESGRSRPQDEPHGGRAGRA